MLVVLLAFMHDRRVVLVFYQLNFRARGDEVLGSVCIPLPCAFNLLHVHALDCMLVLAFALCIVAR
jgi:hypothetical protein